MSTLTTVLGWVLGSSCFCSLLMVGLGTIAVHAMRAKESASDPTEPEAVPPPAAPEWAEFTPDPVNEAYEQNSAFWTDAYTFAEKPWPKNVRDRGLN